MNVLEALAVDSCVVNALLNSLILFVVVSVYKSLKSNNGG